MLTRDIIACVFFINTYGKHQQYHEYDKTGEAPGPAHRLLYNSKHYNGDKEYSGHFIPDAELLGTVLKNTFLLLFEDPVQADKINIQEDHEQEFYMQPGMNTEMFQVIAFP